MAVLAKISSFSGGMNRKVSPLLAKPEEAFICRNTILKRVGSLQKRKGYSLIGDVPINNQVPDTNPVRFLYSFYKYGTSPLRQLLRISGTNFYYLNETTNSWTNATGTITLHDKGDIDATTYGNLAIMVNAADKVLKWNGTTLSESTTIPNGNCITVMKDRIYISKESTVYFSDVTNPESFPSDNNFTVGMNDGDEITALFPYFNSLLIFKHNTIWQYDVDENNEPLSLKPIAYDVGADTFKGISIINAILHFASRRGIYQFSGRFPVKISYRIEDIIDEITTPENFISWEDGDIYHLYIGNSNILGFNDVVINYDSVLDHFTFHEPFKINSVINYINKDGSLKQYFGDDAGKVWTLWEGTTDGYENDQNVGKPIEMEWESLIYQIGDPTVPFEVDEVAWRMDHDAVSPITIEASFDNYQWARVAEASSALGKSAKVHNLAAQAMDVRFRIHEYSSYQSPVIYQIVLTGQVPETSRVLPKKYGK